MMDRNEYKSGVSAEALKSMAAIMFAVGGNSKNDKLMNTVGSTILNRLDTLSPEFGAENGRISEVINKGYLEARSPLYQKALNGEFNGKDEETKFKKAILISSGLVRKSIPRNTADFFFSEEVNVQGKKTNKEDLKFMKSNANSGNKPAKAINKVGKLAGKR